jgi:putative ABC transport system ATP-binding protein/lipoprotein-releasing system ATP-binding protein
MIEVKNLCKSFGNTQILHDINLTINDGDYISLTGRSGSGKTTLLYCVSSLDEPTSGEVMIDGANIFDKTESELHRFLNQDVGFVFQFHYLLPELTALENVLMPARKCKAEDEHKAFAKHLLTQFELSEHMHKLPGQLSGGQAQRVAIARAMSMKPRYLFADEPTGSLDSKNAKVIMDIFDQLNQEEGTTIVCVTHDQEFAHAATMNIELFDGKLVV